MKTLFGGSVDFVLGVAELHQLPDMDRPEIAFAGRSNVGKSSLINALTGRKTLARTSHTPGRTQQLNYFDLDKRMYLVDMPGYGYAKVSKSQRKAWHKLIRSYLKGRASLRCVFILVDSRHGLKDSDQDLMSMLDDAGVSYRIVLTKMDKVKSQALNTTSTHIEQILKKHPAAFPTVMPTSAHKRFGIEDLQETIVGFCV